MAADAAASTPPDDDGAASTLAGEGAAASSEPNERASRLAPPPPPPSRRERGLVGGAWIAWPLAACLLTSLGVAVQIGLRTRPELTPFMAALHGCGMFFAIAYALAWRAGETLLRFTWMGVTVVIWGFLAWYLAHEAPAGEMIRDGALVPRAPEPGLFFAVALLGVSCVLLLVHGLILGFGSRLISGDPHGNSA